MKKKVRKGVLTLSIIVLIILIGVVFYFGFQQDFITINGLPPTVEQSYNWNGNNVDVKSIYIGTISNTGYRDSSGVDTPNTDFCGSNKGDLTISNLVDVNNDLTLSSSYAGLGCNADNFLEAHIDLPKGKLIATCDVSMSNAPQWRGTNAVCEIEDKKLVAYTSVEGGGDSKQETYEIILDKPKTISILLINHPYNAKVGTSSDAKITLSFEPDNQEQLLSTGVTDDNTNNQQISNNSQTTNQKQTTSDTTQNNANNNQTTQPKTNYLFFIIPLILIIFIILIVYGIFRKKRRKR